LGTDLDDRTLTGPATIFVTRLGEPLPCGQAIMGGCTAIRDAGTARLCVDRLLDRSPEDPRTARSAKRIDHSARSDVIRHSSEPKAPILRRLDPGTRRARARARRRFTSSSSRRGALESMTTIPRGLVVSVLGTMTASGALKPRAEKTRLSRVSSTARVVEEPPETVVGVVMTMLRILEPAVAARL
jgi:hypothetical protein